jgi:hypothetical protein
VGGWWFFGFVVLCLVIAVPLFVQRQRAERDTRPPAGPAVPLDPVETRRRTPGSGSALPGA